MKKLFSFSVLAFMFASLLPLASVQASGAKSYKQMFTITGYYSPLPNQDFYITGDYISEKRLNGNGTHGADGTPVYPGMMAGAGSIEYGTVICLPNFGCGKIHDRGQAIVEKGERKLAEHTRLDLWLGYGDEGLLRALSWGVKHYEGEVFAPDSGKEVAVNFQVPLGIAQILDLPGKKIFSQNLGKGDSGEAVTDMQEILASLGFYGGSINGEYGQELSDAVFDFQKSYLILDDRSEAGAGNFGPKTRDKLSSVLYKEVVQERIRDAWNEFHFEKELRKGARSNEVFRLQQMLVEKEYLTVYPTGYFGPKTEEALAEFQIDHGLVASRSTLGAGSMGPKTKELLNDYIQERRDFLAFEEQEVKTYVQVRNTFLQFAHSSGDIQLALAQK